MTPLSILAALVIWSAMWGLMGAIFSVPLLGIMKILLTHTNHPMAKYVIMLIREGALRRCLQTLSAGHASCVTCN